jgi:hypothetical protein
MKQFLRCMITLLLSAGCGAGEALLAQDAPTFLFRIYEDNDFINTRGAGTDNAYTNGTRLDLFYTKREPSRHGIDGLLPKAGANSTDIYGWGIMQLMFTPNDISTPDYQPDDYPYSGALVATHTLYSYNPEKKFDLQTELVAGVIGPASFAAETQTFVHRLIHYQRPMGWSHQFRNDLLVNINMTAEKQLAASGHTLEVIGGAQVFAGTMMNGMAFYPLIRVGKMNPYFQGYIRQYSGSSTENGRRKKWQAYLILKPEAQIIFTNALLEGGMFTGNPNTRRGHTGKSTVPPPYRALRNWMYGINYGAVVSSGNFSISFTQNTSSPAMKGLYSHEVGNISIFFAW